ncbi:hypothetical protein Ciccas_008906, partial [Cichlidogyrus casuarinus]
MSSQQVKSNSSPEVRFEIVSINPNSQYKVSYFYSFFKDGLLYDRLRVDISVHRVFVSRNLIYLGRFSIDDNANYATTFVQDRINEILQNGTDDLMYDFEICISLLFYIYLYKLTTLRFLTFKQVEESFNYRFSTALNSSKFSPRNKELILECYQKKLEILEKSVFNEMFRQPDEKLNIDLSKTMVINEFFHLKKAPKERCSLLDGKKLTINEETKPAKTMTETTKIETFGPKLAPSVPPEPVVLNPKPPLPRKPIVLNPKPPVSPKQVIPKLEASLSPKPFIPKLKPSMPPKPVVPKLKSLLRTEFVAKNKIKLNETDEGI